MVLGSRRVVHSLSLSVTVTLVEMRKTVGCCVRGKLSPKLIAIAIIRQPTYASLRPTRRRRSQSPRDPSVQARIDSSLLTQSSQPAPRRLRSAPLPLRLPRRVLGSYGYGVDYIIAHEQNATSYAHFLHKMLNQHSYNRDLSTFGWITPGTIRPIGMHPLLLRARASIRRNKFLRFGLPFLSFMVLGSFGLAEFTEIRVRKK